MLELDFGGSGHMTPSRRRFYRFVMIVIAILSFSACAAWTANRLIALSKAERLAVTVTSVEKEVEQGITVGYTATASVEDGREIRFTRDEPIRFGSTLELLVRRDTNEVVREGFGMWIPSYLFGGWALLAGVLARVMR